MKCPLTIATTHPISMKNLHYTSIKILRNPDWIPCCTGGSVWFGNGPETQGRLGDVRKMTSKIYGCYQNWIINGI